MIRCPGQDQRYWKAEDIYEIECPDCGNSIEFFKDEPKLKCSRCGTVVINPKIDTGCAQWCSYSEQCSGNSESVLIIDNLIMEMKKVFGDDQKRVTHALNVLNYAEQIQKIEGGDPMIIKAAAVLHDIGIHQAENKYGSSAGKFQEIEGPPIAEKILIESRFPTNAIDHICKIIGNHHSAKDIDTIEFRIVWDADWLVNIPDEFQNVNRDKLQRIINKVFKTKHGRKKAYALFIDKPTE